jgi:hypothetical protein
VISLFVIFFVKTLVALLKIFPYSNYFFLHLAKKITYVVGFTFCGCNHRNNTLTFVWLSYRQNWPISKSLRSPKNSPKKTKRKKNPKKKKTQNSKKKEKSKKIKENII